MYIVAAKAGLGFVVLLAFLGAVETRSVVDPLLLFVTVGLIPGTNLVISPDVVLLTVAAVLMAMTVIWFRRYSAYHAMLDSIMPEYVREGREDPDLTSIVPSLGRLLVAGRSALAAANDASLELYTWFRSFGRPAIAQTISARREIGSAFMRLDRWATAKFDPHERLERLGYMSRRWFERARDYIVRLTVL